MRPNRISTHSGFLLAFSLVFACSKRPVEVDPVSSEDQDPAHHRSTYAELDASETIHVVSLSESEDFVVGFFDPQVWGAQLSASGAQIVWRFNAPGVLQGATAGQLKGKAWVILAFGRGRSRLDAPLSVLKVDPASGSFETLAQWPSPRADFAHLSISDTRNTSSPVLVYAAFESKYFVREWIHPLDEPRIPGEVQRMATSRLFADLDGDGKTDRVVGRIYGDRQTAPGYFRVRFANGSTVEVPVDGGVRSLAVAQTAQDNRPTLYFADGWSANYAREGRAQLKRAAFKKTGFDVKQVAQSPDEYTFNAIRVVGKAGSQEILVYGNKRVSWLQRSISREEVLRPLKGLDGFAFPQIARHHEQVWLLAPGDPTRLEAGPKL